jgi:predicted amidohydrolase YtcJ
MTVINFPQSSLMNARVITMNPDRQIANRIDISGGRIVGLDNDSERFKHIRFTAKPIDVGGRFVLPGLCDSHIHLEKYARMLDQVDCETDSLDECLKRVQARCNASPPNRWVLGHGWNQNLWGRYGTIKELDSISPKNPVYLTAKSLHAGWANSKALEICGLTKESQAPPKGKLQRNVSGELTGVLFEDAMHLVSEKLPKPGDTGLTTMIERAQQTLNKWGITAVHDFDGLECLSALRSLEKQSKLRLRVLKQIRYKDFDEARRIELRSISTGEWIRIGHLKLFSDGALGPRTAAMLEGYIGEPDNLGMLQLDLDELIAIGRDAVKAGYPLAVHAIGDRANRITLDAFENLQAEGIPTHLPCPHRIEHAQLLHPDDLNRPAQLGITLSMQPIHAISDYEMADRYWGDRVRYSYAWNSQFRSGATVIFGSDAPVESPNPWLGIYAAVARKPFNSQGKEAWVKEERITPMEALRAYTTLPARASIWDNQIGQISVGSCADLILLDQDPLGDPSENAIKMHPCGVMVDGEWVYRDF